MLDMIRKFYDLLSSTERRAAVILLLMILVTGIMEAVGVASIMPFLSVLANPEIIKENALLSSVYQSMGFSDTDAFLFFLGVASFFLIVFGLGLRALTEYALARFTHMRNYTLSSRLLRGYLGRSYSWFLNRHSADLGKTVLSEVQQVITQALVPTAEFIAHLVITICLIALLFVVHPLVALCAAVTLGGAYAAIYAVLRRYLSRIGADRVRANQERFQVAQEVFGGIKEVKASGLEAGYLNGFAKPARRFARRQAANMVIARVPRFLLQALAFGGILVVVLVLLVVRDGELAEVLPVLGVFAFAGQRMLPALQKVYQNAAKMRFGKPAVDALHKDLMGTSFDEQALERLNKARRATPMGLNHSLDLVNVDFRYPEADGPAIRDLNLTVDAHTSVGFVGPTGAGKTTVVDLILGLLKPTEGDIRVDGNSITGERLASWQRSLGYVPQQIFLADDSVTANIAFGVPKNEIDQEAVERAARIAELHNFVVDQLPQGYETTVGERGVRLSGGQRQRIGIARALYHDPDVLVLDEATSNVDSATEKAIVESVNQLKGGRTIIMIAHRLTSVKNCDCLYFLKDGRLDAAGTYDELFENHEEFRVMAG